MHLLLIITMKKHDEVKYVKSEWKKRYLRTDMAQESYVDAELENGVRGIKYREENIDGFQICRLDITNDEGAKILNRQIGTYVTVTVGRIWLADDECFARAVSVLSEEIKGLIKKVCHGPHGVLVAGLGNRYIASDSIGPLTVKGLTVTRHLRELDPELFSKLSSLPLSAVTPGVVGQTGIETAEIVRGAVSVAQPSLIIAVDALAARSVDRLAVTVQLSDSGISPGSGIGNRRSAIDKNALGVPVISVGVPTVVDSSTLVCDMFEQAGINDIPDQMRSVLDNGKSFFVTLKDADAASAELARLISSAIQTACS